MPTIYMKEFSDIAVAGGTKKISKIRKEKNKSDYHPAQDYYKQIREAIVDAYRKNLGIKTIINEAEQCANPKKKNNFIVIAKKFTSWAGKKDRVWVTPPRTKYSHSSTDIILNPEIGLNYDGKTHVIKLYFSEEKMNQNRANYMIYLMKNSLPSEFDYHVMDIRRKKLFVESGNESNYLISIKSEISGIESAWESID